MNLTFKYKRNSTLPRRTFIVNVDWLTADGTIAVKYDVTAPDALAAEAVARKRITANLRPGERFMVTMLREVVANWDDQPYVKVPYWYESRVNS